MLKSIPELQAIYRDEAAKFASARQLLFTVAKINESVGAAPSRRLRDLSTARVAADDILASKAEPSAPAPAADAPAPHARTAGFRKELVRFPGPETH
jgi:hypothetical protein